MGDVQEQFIAQQCAQLLFGVDPRLPHRGSGGEPIRQLAFTLANGFTYVEYYLSARMNINDFGPNLSFFFSNGVDPEYAVIGRVARRIWARAMRDFKIRRRRALAEAEVPHPDLGPQPARAGDRLQRHPHDAAGAVCAVYDNCNSLHTNAYDEAITTPTEEWVRRAVAIQLIINEELGGEEREPLQGSFFLDELTDLVEEAVFPSSIAWPSAAACSARWRPCTSAAASRTRSLYYEHMKHDGSYPIVGVNTFLNPDPSSTPFSFSSGGALVNH